MTVLTAEKKLEILKKVKDLAKKNYQNLSTQKDESDADAKLAELESSLPDDNKK